MSGPGSSVPVDEQLRNVVANIQIEMSCEDFVLLFLVWWGEINLPSQVIDKMCRHAKVCQSPHRLMSKTKITPEMARKVIEKYQ